MHVERVKYLNFLPPEAVSRYRNPDFKWVEIIHYMCNLGPNMCKSRCLNTHFIPKISDLIGKLNGLEMTDVALRGVC